MKPKCAEHKNFYFIVHLAPTNRPDLAYFPKYIPMIKKYCFDCDAFIKTEAQIPELIEHINKELSQFRIPPTLL